MVCEICEVIWSQEELPVDSSSGGGEDVLWDWDGFM
jgi:hypothetical protein